MSRANQGMIGVWGRRGSGKSSWIKQHIAGHGRVVIFDPMEEYQATTRIGHTSPDAIDQVRAAMAANWTNFQISYRPPATRRPEALHLLSITMMRANQGFKDGRHARPMLMVVEEMNSAFSVAGGEHHCPGFAELCSRGRHFGIAVVGASQRIAEVSTRFRGNCDETVIFAQKGPRDLAAAEAETGAPRKEIAALKTLEYIHEKNGKRRRGKITF